MTALAPFPSFFPSHDPKITRREDEKEEGTKLLLATDNS